MQVYLSNNKVAWQIPHDDIDYRYANRYYFPPEGWVVIEGMLPNYWREDEFGIFRNHLEEMKNRKSKKIHKGLPAQAV